MPNIPEGYEGCARPCWNTGLSHTYAWGSCALADAPPRPDPQLGWWRITEGGDGGSSMGLATIPFLVIFPWARHLPLDERYQMVEDLTDSKDPAQTLRE